MKGFEIEDWELDASYRDVRRYKHKRWPFILVECRKIKKGYKFGGRYTASTWKLSIQRWRMLSSQYTLNKSILKFDIKYLIEFFNKAIESDETKHIILDYLFEGKY